MTERLAFVTACLNRDERIVDICARFGISEKTGHKLLQRFREAGPSALLDRSHARHHQPHRMTAQVATRILALRRRYPDYGPVKLRDWLRLHEPQQAWPAASTIGELLVRADLVRPRRRRSRSTAHARLEGAPTAATAPNHVWTADFKGEFRVPPCGGAYCYPLTVLDLHSHYLLGCRALASTSVASARDVFVRLFRTYGLPAVIRTDNGVPFAQPNALGRLGALAFWWIRLGIRPEHITPARPSENGAHERFHKTLKAATAQPAAPSVHAQQHRFDAFQREYNAERPHASLPAHAPPEAYNTASPRPYPTRVPVIRYADGTLVRRVDPAGCIKWKGRNLFLSSNLAGQDVALVEGASDQLTIQYATLALGEFDPRQHRFTPHVRWLGDAAPARV
jgi:transposase InsO family protein